MNRVREQFDLHPLAIHVSYLINLASVDPVIRAKSIQGFREELVRALESGIGAFVSGMSAAAKGLPKRLVTVLLENTVGCGAQIGSKFDELRAIHDAADIDTGFCLDTCHLLAAGFDVASYTGIKRTIAEAARILGLENVRVIHANDSKGALGSKLDRHMNIGEGQIGLEGFGRILNHPYLRDKPFILETPVDHPGDDQRNVDALKNLCKVK